MKQFTKNTLTVAILLQFAMGLAYANEQNNATEVQQILPTIEVQSENYHSSEQSQSYSVTHSQASKLNIEAKETPQTINVITHQQINDFALNNIRDVLSNTAGVSVSNLETERTNYLARGFEISNVNKDGIGFPETSYNYHQDNQDMFFFDRVEVIKGADALNNAFGDPSATVNLIRKRPTADFQAQANLHYGSWDTARYELDVSGALHDRVRARLMGYQQNGDSYLDRYQLEKNGISGIVDIDLAQNTDLSVGYTHSNHKPNAVNWGSNPLLNTDGKQITHARTYNYAPSWTYWDFERENYFIELNHKFNDDWKAQLHYEGSKDQGQSKLLYLSGTPASDNTSGVYLYPGHYDEETKSKQFALNITGKLRFLQREHDLALGYRWADKSYVAYSYSGTLANHITTDLASWTAPEPTWGTISTAGADYTQKFHSAYLAGRWQLTQDFKLITGLNYVQASASGTSYGADQFYDVNKVSPYVGLTYNFTPEYTAYASYLSIFRPQTGIDATTGKAVEPIKGKSYEMGIKSSWLDNRLMGTLAIFRTEEQNYPLREGDADPINRTVSVSDLRSQGVEIGLNGQITNHINASFGYSNFSFKDLKNGGEARTYTPHQSINLLTTYRIPALPKLKLGLGLQWNDKTYLVSPATASTATGTIRQKSYALVNAMASYEFNPHIQLQLNANNITNTNYLYEFPYKHGMRGAPRNYMATLSFKY